ncbi:MAG: C25 family cysteine peptidase [Candidatus Cloacimonadales bacterium]
MKKLLTVLAIFATISFLQAATFTHTYSFSQPEIVTDNGESVLIFTESVNLGDEGNPLIPQFAATLLLPQDSELQNIRIISTEYETLDQPIRLKPAGKVHPISQPVAADYQTQPNAAIYQSDQAYPEQIIEHSSTHYLGGHSIGSFIISPLRYYPSQNRVDVLKNITLEISTTTARNAQNLRQMLSSTSLTQQRVSHLVDNQSQILNYSYANTTRDEEVDLLLITSAELANYFNDYVDYKRSTGYITEVVLVGDIAEDYPGADLQEKIRNCIIDYYQNKNLQYAILGGDADPQNAADNIIPHRGFYGSVGDNVDNDIPSDLYYSNLDGTWNDDNDQFWGEADEADLLTEVIVGRIAVDSPTEVLNMTNKLYMYQNEPVIDDIETFLLTGEYLWPETYGGMYMDELIGLSNANGYTTNGITENITINTLYEQTYAWGSQDIFNQFNNVGVNMLHHLGHSNTDYNMHLYNYHVTESNFTNDGVNRGYVLGYSQGCYPGSFDNRSTSANSYGDDCIAERLTTIATGEAAFVANSRYGWGMQGSTDGASQHFHREYVDAIFGENITTMGGANTDSKEDKIALINSQTVMRWVAYELTLFGDPSLNAWTANPTDMVVNHTPSVSIGSSQINFSTSSANARIALMQSGQLIGRGLTDDFGSVLIETFQPISNAEPISVSAIAHNKNRYQGEILVVSDQPYVVVESTEINDEDGNGQVDYAEAVQLDITMKNVGTEPATDVNVILSTDNPYITITEAEANFGDFAAAQEINLQDVFAFEVAEFIPDLENVSFTLTASDADYEDWNSNFNLVLHAPVLTNDNVVINDTSGNNNGLFDPGETIQLILPINNIGHSTSPEINATLSSNNPNVTMETASVEVESVDVGSAEDAVFQFALDSAIPVGEVITFNFDVSAADYTFSNTLSFSVGLIIEDFETGDFSAFDWEFGANPFEISDGATSGDYCIKSAAIGSNQDSSIEITLDVLADGEISFFRKVSCESAPAGSEYDYLAFYIDGEQQDTWDGEEGWVEVAFEVAAGERTFKWEYHKDGYVDSGADAAWIDKITFPSVSIEVPPTISANIYEIEHEMGMDETHEVIFNLSNIGTGELEYSIAGTPTWLNLSPTSGILAGGEYNEISVEISTENLSTITYNSNIIITDNFENEIVIPVSVSVTEVSSEENVPLITELKGNFPNPFNPTTTISFALASAQHTNLQIYNAKGQLISTLLNEELEAGYHDVVWDGKDRSGKNVASGIFFYRFQTAEKSTTRKMLLLK